MAARWSLRVVTAEDGPRTHVLPEEGTVVIGRGPESDLRVDDRSLSRRHAAVTVADGAVRIADLGSANGTRVAERALDPDEPALLEPGEVIDLGEVMIVFLGTPSPERLQRLVRRVARAQVNVLVQGEPGADRSATAQRVHQLSPRAGRPFLRLDCRGLTEPILRDTVLDAGSGTLFLDEIGELSPALQEVIVRLAGERQLRTVAATHRDLEAEVARGAFRRDLLDHIAGITLGS